MCFEYEVQNSLKAKNNDKAFEEVELEPELEKIEEQSIVLKSWRQSIFLLYFQC